MKSKLLKCSIKFKNGLIKAKPYVFSFAIMCAMLFGNVAFAAGEGKSLFEIIIKALGGLALAGAAIYGGLGLVAYGEAKTEGNGPAMAQAKNQITGAIMIAVVGAALTAGANQIAVLVTDIKL